MRKLRLWLGCAGCLCLSLPTARADAADLKVNPTSLVMAEDQHDAEISFSNLGDRPLLAQVRLYRWTRQQGQDRLSPARDLAVSPQLLEIPPHAQHIVRLIRLTDTSEPVETGYRIVVDELPDISEGREKSPLLRYSAPVFLASADGSASVHPLTASVSQHGDRTLLRIDNHGSGHARLADLAYVATDGRLQWLAKKPGRLRTARPLPPLAASRQRQPVFRGSIPGTHQ
ncbi:fimbrial biogenesis chaperone [Pseudoxanthomonas wuyuanensis]